MILYACTSLQPVLKLEYRILCRYVTIYIMMCTEIHYAARQNIGEYLQGKYLANLRVKILSWREGNIILTIGTKFANIFPAARFCYIAKQ